MLNRKFFVHIRGAALKVAVMQAPVFLLKDATHRTLHPQLEIAQSNRLRAVLFLCDRVPFMTPLIVEKWQVCSSSAETSGKPQRQNTRTEVRRGVMSSSSMERWL